MFRRSPGARAHRSVSIGLASWCAAAALATSAGASSAAQSQQPGAPAAVEPAATARIAGQVVASDTGAPVKRTPVFVQGGTPRPTEGPAAVVSILGPGTSFGSAPPGMTRREVMTDDAGRFECADLPPGRYSAMVRATGPYLAPAPQTFELTVGGSASLTFRLDRGGIISGRVLDDGGEPVERARVSAVQRRSVSGVWRLVQASSGSSATTDDLGQFRLYGLPPGEFYVSASYAVPMMGPVAVQASSEPRLGFAPTYFPSAAGIEGARKVAVKLGQETGGIDVTLVRAKLGSVSARVTDSAGAGLSSRQVSVMLMPRRDSTAGMVTGGSRWQEDGTYVIANVPPGRYVLVATVRQEQPGPSSPVEAGFELVAIDGDDVAVQIQTNTGATVSGRVVIEGAKPVQGWQVAGMTGPARASIMVRSMEADVYVPSNIRGPVYAGEDLSFSVTGLRGRQALTAMVPGAALKSVTQGGKDITASGLWLKGTESIEGVAITVTTDTAAIDGQVVSADGGPGNAWIVVFPDDSSKWFAGSPFVRVLRSRPTAAPDRATASVAAPGPVPGTSAVSLQAGGFRLQSLLPGRYAVAVTPFADAQPGETGSMPPTDPESLAALRVRATMVSVAAGETATLQLKLPK